MSLNDDCKVIFAGQVNTLDRMLVVTEDANAKKFSLNELPVTVRNRKGLKIVTNKEKIFKVISPIVTGEIVIMDNASKVFAVDVNNINIGARTDSCKPIIKKSKMTVKDVGLYLN